MTCVVLRVNYERLNYKRKFLVDVFYVILSGNVIKAFRILPPLVLEVTLTHTITPKFFLETLGHTKKNTTVTFFS